MLCTLFPWDLPNFYLNVFGFLYLIAKMPCPTSTMPFFVRASMSFRGRVLSITTTRWAPTVCKRKAGFVFYFDLIQAGFQKSCAIIILTDGRNGHQSMVRPDTVNLLGKSNDDYSFNGCRKRQHGMHSGEISTKMCSLVASKPHQQIAQL